MTTREHGNARLAVFAGVGLIGLLAAVAIMLIMGGNEAEQSGKTYTAATQQVGQLQKQLTEHGLRVQEAGRPGGLQGQCSVILEDVGPDKITIIKTIRELTGLGLAEAQNLAENPPATIKAGLTPLEADAVSKQLIASGATARVEQTGQ